MESHELKRLKKLEKRIYEIAREGGLDFDEIEFDIVPAQKMFEMMAYNMPGQISNWKFGRDYERVRTVYEKKGDGLPYEVVVDTNPPRAYLMKDNTIALQALIIAHVVGHVAFYKMNRYSLESDKEIATRLGIAAQRFEEYENRYGIDLVEQTVDAAHALMWHSNPFIKEETEAEKLERIFEKLKQKKHDKGATEFRDFFTDDDQADIEREKWNNELYLKLKRQVPVEPMEDILRFIIDHSRNIADWQKDILEIIRSWGQYILPNISTKYMNEGFATYWHEKIMRQLAQEGLISHDEHAECNYVNSLVKAKNPASMNPYLVGYEIWCDIIKRWNKGQHGYWENIEDHEEKVNYNDKSMRGMEKMFQVLRTSNDWMFMYNFLNNDLIRKLKLYMYVKTSNPFVEEVVIADKKVDEIRNIIIKSFSHNSIPQIFVVDGNFQDKNDLMLKHEHIGIDLNAEYARKTLQHIQFLWGQNVALETIKNKQKHHYKAVKPKKPEPLT